MAPAEAPVFCSEGQNRCVAYSRHDPQARRTHEVEETAGASYEQYARVHLFTAFGDVPIGKVNARLLEEFYAELRRCRDRCEGRPKVEHRVDGLHDCRIVKHCRGPGRPPNPAVIARKPRQPTPQPSPPTVAQATQIIEAAWQQGPGWHSGVAGHGDPACARAELLALRSDIELDAAVVTVRRNYVRVNRKSLEKDTKTHQRRRLARDPATVEVLAEHRERYEALCREVRTPPRPDAFLFSYRPEHDSPCDPSGVTHRYAKMCADLGIDSHLHALRQYSATELLTAGVDLRTVAGRLGHGGGGATTLRVYAAWVGKSDRRAADLLGGRIRRLSSR